MSTDSSENVWVNSGEERSVLYEKGLQFKRNDSFQNALQCFLGCLQDMKENINFPELPECLHNIAEIYSELGEYEKAIEFAQAEKLFYETALIQADKNEPDELKEQENKTTELIDPDASSEEAVRANEYEKLSQICLKEKKVQLALEYAGKATQLRKNVYGDSHVITVKSLNLFTMMYAEMGKQQYSAAMAKMSNSKETHAKLEKTAVLNGKPAKDDENTDQKTEQESIQEEKSSEENQVIEEEGPSETQEENDEAIFGRTFFIYFFFTLLTSVIITAVACCIIGVDITTLHSLLLQKLKFYYYYYYYNSSISGIKYM